MNLKKFDKIDIILDNCEVITFDKTEIIKFELSENIYESNDENFVSRFNMIVDKTADRTERCKFIVFGEELYPITENDEISTRNNFDRIMTGNDIIKIILIKDDWGVSLVIPYDLQDSPDSKKWIVESVENRSFLDEDGNLHINITMTDDMINTIEENLRKKNNKPEYQVVRKG